MSLILATRWGDRLIDVRALRADEPLPAAVEGLRYDVLSAPPPDPVPEWTLGEDDFRFARIAAICVVVAAAALAVIASSPAGNAAYRSADVFGEGAGSYRPTRWVGMPHGTGRRAAVASAAFGLSGRLREAELTGTARDAAGPAGLVGLLRSAENQNGVFGGRLDAELLDAMANLRGERMVGTASGTAGLGFTGRVSATGGTGGAGLGWGEIGVAGARGGGGEALTGRRGEDPTVSVKAMSVIGSLPKEVIARVVSRHKSEIKFCYDAELRANPSLTGRVVTTFTIGPIGYVVSARVAESTISNPRLHACMLDRIRSWRFPESAGGGVVVVNYPWRFERAGE